MRTLAGILIMAFAASAACGEEASVLEEEILVLARRLPKAADATGATVTLIDLEDLESRQARNGGLALLPVPGVWLNFGAPGAGTSVFLRGAASNQTLVLVDGVQMNDPTVGGQFNFFDLGLENIDRVEVLRGASSSLYGSDAGGGVVNYVTRRGEGPPGGRLLLEGGSYGYYRGGLSGSGGLGIFDFSGEIARTRYHNDLADQEYLNDTYALGVGVSPVEELRISVQARYIDAEAEDPWDFPFGPQIEEDENIERQKNTMLWAVALEHDAWEGFTWNFTASRLHVNSLFQNGPDVAGGPLELRSRAEAELRNATISGRHAVPEIWADLSADLLVGFEYEDELSESRVRSAFGPSPDLERTVRNRSVFALLELEAFERLVVSVGLRRDKNSFFGWETTVSASALYRMAASGTRFRVNYGEAFRAPKPVEFDDPFIGNADLEPEETVTLDAGVEQDFLDGDVTVRATWFQGRTTNLIAYDSTTFLLENLSKARTRGVELSGEARLLEGLDLRAWLTIQDPLNLDPGDGVRRSLPGRSERFGGGEVRYRGDGWQAALSVLASGDFPSTGRITPDGVHRSHPGRKLLVALAGEVVVRPGFRVHARIENLLNYEWYDNDTVPGGLGRGFYLGASLDF